MVSWEATPGQVPGAWRLPKANLPSLVRVGAGPADPRLHLLKSLARPRYLVICTSSPGRDQGTRRPALRGSCPCARGGAVVRDTCRGTVFWCWQGGNPGARCGMPPGPAASPRRSIGQSTGWQCRVAARIERRRKSPGPAAAPCRAHCDDS
jgi:hypothetical protein